MSPNQHDPAKRFVLDVWNRIKLLFPASLFVQLISNERPPQTVHEEVHHAHLVARQTMKRDRQWRAAILSFPLRKLRVLLDPSRELSQKVLFERHRMERFQLLVIPQIRHEDADLRQAIGKIDILGLIGIAQFPLLGLA